jgi:hypothetical protein
MARGYPDYGKHINRVGVYSNRMMVTAGEDAEETMFEGQANSMYEITHFAITCEPYAVDRIKLMYNRVPTFESLCIYHNELVTAKLAVIFPSRIFLVGCDFLSLDILAHATENCDIWVSFMYKEHYIPDDYIMELLGE